MIRRITLDNYMSHAHTVIEPADGLTVLIGPNNCGKSAVVSALQTVCDNESGGYMVRHDEKEARVTIETDDGHVIVWRRKGNAVRYIFDGREVDRRPRDVVEDLHKILKLPRVDDQGKTDIHFGTQKSPIFLLNEPESKAASFFASSSDAAVLVDMQKRHRAKVADAKRDEKRLADEVDQLDRELETLRPLQELAESAAMAENRYRELEELSEAIRGLDQEITELESRWAEQGRLCRYFELLEQVKPTPEVADTSPLDTAIRNIGKAQQNVDENETRLTALKTLKSPPDLKDVPALEGTVRELDGAGEAVGFLTKKIAYLATLRENPVFSDTASMDGMVRSLDSAQQLVEKLAHQTQLLETLRPVPEFWDPSSLGHFVETLKTAIEAVEGKERLSDIAASDAEMARKELAAADQSVPAVQTVAPSRAPVILAGGLLFAAIVILIVVFARTWFTGLDRRPDHRSSGEDIAAETSQKQPASELPKKVLKEPSDDAKKPVVDEKRLKQVRQLLAEAQKASEEARFLDAIFGFGQAAVLFPDELALAERPEKVRSMFLDALGRYQAQVEQALEKAKKAKRSDK